MHKIKDKIKRMPSSAKSSIAFVFSSLIIKGFGFIVTPIFTRIMNADEYGVVTTYNSWVSILEIFALLGLTSAGIFNVGLNDHKDNRDKYITSCLGLCNFSTLIVFFAILIMRVMLGGNTIIDDKLLAVMFVHFLFSPAQLFWITRQRYEYKYKMATIVSIFSVLVAQVLAVFAVLKVGGASSFNKIIGNEIGTLLFAIPIYILLLKRGKDYTNIKLWKSTFFLALPLIPHYLSQHVMSGSDKIMLSNMVGSSEAAIYGVVANIGMIGTIFWNAVNASLVPFSFEKIENNRTKDIDNLCKKLLFGYASILLVIILMAPEILRILAPSEYFNGIYCVPPLTFVVYLHALYNLFANIEFYGKKTRVIAVATVSATVFNLGLNYLLIPKFGFIGAAYATLVSNILLVVFHYIGYKHTKTNRIYDGKYILILSAVFLAISCLSNLLYINDYLRYALIIMAIIVLIAKRKTISALFATLKEK